MVKKKAKETKIFCDLTKCMACRACEMACAMEHSISKDVYKILKEEKRPKKRVKVSAVYPVRKTWFSNGVNDKSISIRCKHCIDAPCVTACMSGAMYKDKETNATMHNKAKCVGCWMCVMACPYGAIVMDINEKIAIKCDLCPDRDDFACVTACPTGALFAGTEDEFKKMLKNHFPLRKWEMVTDDGGAKS